MNRLLVFGAALGLSAGFTSASFADEYVRGHTRSDGTYVAPHHRSDPNSVRYDNYSGRGNTNPYTGERGSERHEYTNPPEYNRGRQSHEYTPPPIYPSGNIYDTAPRRTR